MSQPPSPEPSADSDPDVLGSVTLLLQHLRTGDQAAGLDLWSRYLPRLTALAKTAVGGRILGPADADDAVQSAWISFWKKLDAGVFPTDLKRDDFWNLLGLMVVRKSRRQIRRESASKRGGGQVVLDSELAAGNSNGGLDAFPGQMSLGEFDLHTEELLQMLDPECQRIAILRMMSWTTREMAAEFGCTERKIQRKLELIRLKWRAWIQDF